MCPFDYIQPAYQIDAAARRVGKAKRAHTAPESLWWAPFALPTLQIMHFLLHQADGALSAVSDLGSCSSAGLRLGNVSSHLMMELKSAP